MNFSGNNPGISRYYPRLLNMLGKSRADALTEIESAHDSKEAKARLLSINSALERMRIGVYGICESCESYITLQRLFNCPEAEFCAACDESAISGDRAA